MGSLGSTPLQLLDVKGDDGIAELIKLSISLDEWIRLDAVDIDYENEVDGEKLKILERFWSYTVEIYFLFLGQTIL